MNRPDVLLISDPGYEGPSFLFNLASKISSEIIWIASEPPPIIDSIIKSYKFSGKIHIATPKQWRGYDFVNLMNLNEVSIAISKAGENARNFALIISVLPELLLIHGLEKTYLFMLNTIWKTQNQGGFTLALLTKGAQGKREETIMSRPFAMVFRLRKKLIKNKWQRELIVESPYSSVDVNPINVSKYQVEIPELVWEVINNIKI